MKLHFLTNFMRENSNVIQFFSLLKLVNFDTKIKKLDHFSSFSRICNFWTKNGIKPNKTMKWQFLIDFRRENSNAFQTPPLKKSILTQK